MDVQASPTAPGCLRDPKGRAQTALKGCQAQLDSLHSSSSRSIQTFRWKAQRTPSSPAQQKEGGRKQGLLR